MAQAWASPGQGPQTQPEGLAGLYSSQPPRVPAAGRQRGWEWEGRSGNRDLSRSTAVPATGVPACGDRTERGDGGSPTTEAEQGRHDTFHHTDRPVKGLAPHHVGHLRLAQAPGIAPQAGAGAGLQGAAIHQGRESMAALPGRGVRGPEASGVDQLHDATSPRTHACPRPRSSSPLPCCSSASSSRTPCTSSMTRLRGCRRS